LDGGLCRASGGIGLGQSSPLTAPLSAHEQRQLRAARGSRLPLLVVLLALVLMLVVPRVVERRISAYRREAASAQTAAFTAMRIQLALATETAAERGFLLTRDTILTRQLNISRRRRRLSEQQLLRATRHLTSSIRDSLVQQSSRLVAMNARLDSLTVAFETSRDDSAITEEQRVLNDSIKTFGDQLATAFQALAQDSRTGADEAEAKVAIVTAALLALGVGAALLVGRLGRRYRTLALKLDENEARFRQIVENLSDVVWLAEPGLQKHLYVNAAYERVWGRSRETLAADPSSFILSVHPEDRPAVLSALVDVEKADTEIEFRVVRPDGSIRWVASRSFPVRDGQGRIFRVGGILEDITENRRNAAERDRLLAAERVSRAEAETRKAQLERVTESRGRLIRGFTHDVKNPLGAADAYLALIEEDVYGALRQQQRSAIAKVRGAIRNALELIAQVLEATRAEAGELEVEQRDTDVGALVGDVADAFRPAADVRHLSLDLHLSNEVPHVYTDGKRVRQIVANLVSNAVKYTNDGGHIDIYVDGPSTRSDTEVRIAVADDGPGIPKGKQSDLFLEFTRLDPKAAEGAGIGLAFSQKVAQALGGKITVHSGDRPGTTFVLHLPLDARDTRRDRGSIRS
jgi:PAS domain S-box-containing protein